MSSIFTDGALHPGRDPNDAWWIVVRRPQDWGDDPRPPGDYHTRYDASRMLLELAPLPLAEASAELPEVVAPDGTRYVLDPIRDQILWQRPCDAQLGPLPGVGGTGSTTGRFRRPVALALDDRGLLYVVDRGNHRVQVIEADASVSRVVVVLGATDAWGRPLAGDGPGQLDDPVGVAVGQNRLYVATANGWIQSYDRMFRVGARFRALRPGTSTIEVVAVGIAGSDDVVVAEAGWSRLGRFDCGGRFLGELGVEEAPAGLFGAFARARFAPDGTRVVGPIDGGVHGMAWHEVIVDAVLPPGTRIEVQTWAADAVAAPPPIPESVPPLPLVTPWAPEIPVALPAEKEPPQGEIARPVMPDTSDWVRARGAPYRRRVTSFDLQGTGPNAASTLTIRAEDARCLRASDQIEFRTATGRELATIGVIAPRGVSLIARGSRVLYGAGTEIRLLEREGRAFDELLMATLGVADAIDLSAIPVEGGGADVPWPHGAAALLRRGDVIALRRGPDLAKVQIEAIDTGPASITLTAAVLGDFRTSKLGLVEAAGRLVLEHAVGWGDGFPPGSTIDVSHLAGSTLGHTLATVVWSDTEIATVWIVGPAPAGWISIAPAAEPRATDRGRYLWVKLRLRGALRHAADTAAAATPLVRSLRLVGPRLSYLGYLPALFARHDADAPTGSLFLERYLALFEGRLTRVEARYEAVARLLNPLASDDEWLDFVATWFDLALDPSWPRARRARLLSQIFELYRLRGTPEGILRFVEAYTGHRPELIEGFQIRPRSGLLLGCAGILGCAPLGGLDIESAAAEDLLAAYAHRFTLVARVDDDCDRDAAEQSLRKLIDAVKPAHADVDLRIASPHGRIGFESMIGVDFVLGDDRRRSVPLGSAGADHRPAPILGVDAVLPPSSHASLDGGTSSPVGDFTIR